jgi:hypothetical protein
MHRTDVVALTQLALRPAYRTRLRTHQTENRASAIARTMNNADSIPWNNQ